MKPSLLSKLLKHPSIIVIATYFFLSRLLKWFFPDCYLLLSTYSDPWIVGYLLGSIPFGLLLTKFTGGPDLRKVGSGNIGTTNVLRASSKKIAALTLLLDMGKGTLAVLLWKSSPDLMPAAAIGAVLGHIFPVWLNWKGGKGLATYFGVILGLAWPVGLTCLLIWILIAYISRYSSLAALVAVASSPLAATYLGYPNLLGLTIFLGSIVYLRHWENIVRLARGTESRIGDKTKTNDASRNSSSP